MRYKIYVVTLIVFVLSLIAAAGILHFLDITYTENDLIRKYQIKKLGHSKGKKIDLLIVGDSSGGNAIDAAYLGKLAHCHALSLSLTASYGLEGTLNMLKRARKKHKEIRTVLIVHSFDVWRRAFERTAFFETLPDKPMSLASSLIPSVYTEYLSFIFNIKEIKWFFKNLAKPYPRHIDPEHDYTRQRSKRFSNHEKELKTDTHIDEHIQPAQLKLLEKLDNYCYTQKLNCILMNGPIHATVAQRSKKALQHIRKTAAEHMHHIVYIDDIFSLVPDHMGDEPDHVDPAFKDKITQIYYSHLKDLLHCNAE